MHKLEPFITRFVRNVMRKIFCYFALVLLLAFSSATLFGQEKNDPLTKALRADCSAGNKTACDMYFSGSRFGFAEQVVFTAVEKTTHFTGSVEIFGSKKNPEKFNRSFRVITTKGDFKGATYSADLVFESGKKRSPIFDKERRRIIIFMDEKFFESIERLKSSEFSIVYYEFENGHVFGSVQTSK